MNSLRSLRSQGSIDAIATDERALPSRILRRAAVGVVVAFALAACGEPVSSSSAAGEVAGAEEADVEEQPPAEPEPPVEDAVEEAGGEAGEPVVEEATATEEDADPQDEQVGEEQSSAADDDTVVGPDGLLCSLPVDPSGTPMSPEDYDALVGPLNGQLEQVAFDMDLALSELEDGISDGPSLESDLQELAIRYAEITAPVIDITPPTGAEDWHDRLVNSWLSVCTSIADGYAGVTEGDDDRFQAFADSLREFPSIINELHANAMCGPFEEC